MVFRYHVGKDLAAQDMGVHTVIGLLSPLAQWNQQLGNARQHALDLRYSVFHSLARTAVAEMMAWSASVIWTLRRCVDKHALLPSY